MKQAGASAGRYRLPFGIRVVLLGAGLVLGLACAKAVLFPEHPDSWYRIHKTRGLSMNEVRDILSQSGAQRISVDSDGDELWRLRHRFGAWTVSVSPYSDGRLFLAHVRYDSTVFPSIIRMRNYPNP